MTRINRTHGVTVGVLDVLGALGSIIGSSLKPRPRNPSVVKAASVTQNGVTFTFDKPYPVGQFVNGDWWVLPNVGDSAVTVTAISPVVTGSGATLRNGQMANPLYGYHAFDGRPDYFDATKLLTLPVAASPNTSIAKAVSRTTPEGTASRSVYVENMVVLTVLASAPPADAMRPPCYGSAKPVFRQSTINMGLLPSLAPPSGAYTLRSLADVVARYAQVQEYSNGGSNSGGPLPRQSFTWPGALTANTYGEEIARDNGESILRTFLNDSVSSKLGAVTALVQAGLDIYGMAVGAPSGGWAVAAMGGGGYNGGLRYLAAYAAWLLNDSTMKTIVQDASRWGEPVQFKWVNSDGLVHFQGAAPGMALFGNGGPGSGVGAFEPFPFYSSPGGFAGSKDRNDPLGLIDGGFTVTLDAGKTTVQTADWGSNYGAIATCHAILASTICSIVPALRTIFNDDVEIFYADRVWEFGHWMQPDNPGARPYANWTLVDALHNTDALGVWLSSYASAFGHAMRTAYYTTTWTG